MVTEAGETQVNGPGAEADAGPAGADAGAGRAREDEPEAAEAEADVAEVGAAEADEPMVVRVEPGDESLASYARIAPRPPERRPTRRELLGGGDATKAPKRLAAGELRPITGDSSGISWDDPEEL